MHGVGLPLSPVVLSPSFISLAKKRGKGKRDSKHVSKIPKHAFQPLSKSRKAMYIISAMGIHRLMGPVFLFWENLLHRCPVKRPIETSFLFRFRSKDSLLRLQIHFGLKFQ